MKRSLGKPEISETEQRIQPKGDNQKEELLDMNVYEDKDYDIDEVKILNFISKSKSTKPTIVRTLVYKTPESSYIVRKCIVERKEEPESICDTKNSQSSLNMSNSTQTAKKFDTQSDEKDQIVEKNKMYDEKMPQKESEISLQKECKPHLSDVNKSKPFVSVAKTQVKVETAPKFHSDDVIMIDEDDDIIEHDQPNEEPSEEPNDEEANDRAKRQRQLPESINTTKSSMATRRHKKPRTKSTI